jgi:hypothetical protein
VRVLSRLFRRLFLKKLIEAHDAHHLMFFGNHANLADPNAFAAFLAPLKDVEWVVYAKEPFAGPEPVLRYLSRYTHRVAISNRRLVAADDGGVAFRWKDYRLDGPNRWKTMTSIPSSSSAASSCTSCPKASTASGTTACSPTAASRAPRSSPALAS